MTMLRRAALLSAATIAVLVAAYAAHAQIQSSAQQRCLTRVTSAGVKVAKAQSKEVRGCLRVASRYGLAPGDGLACLLADGRGRVGSSEARTVATFLGSCATPASFGLTSATAVNGAAVEEEIGLALEVFGPTNVEAGLPSAVDPNGSGCQASVQRAYERVLAAKLKRYARCQKDGLRTVQITSATGLADCVQGVQGSPDQKVSAALARLVTSTSDACTGVDVGSAFPGRCEDLSSSAALAACVAEAVDCRACTMLSLMHGLAVDCDAFDDGLANASCSSGIDVTTTTSTSTTTIPGGTTTTTLGPTTTTSTSTTLPPPSTTTTTTLPPAGACTNPADQAVLAGIDIQTETLTCTFGCLASPTRAQCIANCVVAATGLSPDCALCYGESSECGINFCAGVCAANPNAPACVACIEANCLPAFELCAGTPTASTTTTTTGLPTTTTTSTTTLPPDGACDNAADEAIVGSVDLQAETTTCTVACLSAPNRVACINACLAGATGLSVDCSQCYALSAECGLQNCAGSCAANPSGAPCQACLQAACIPAFDACAGFGDPPPATCGNSTQDGDETDVDCGGSCGPCPIGDGCGGPQDCSSGECVAGTCSAPTTPIALGSCINGYIDPLSDPDGVDLGVFTVTGSDDGYRLTLATASDVAIELTNQLNGTATLSAAIVTTPGVGGGVAAGLQTGAVVTGQNGTGGPSTLGPGTYYLYVDSQVANTYGPYQICVVPPPSVSLNSCATANVGNGDGDDVHIAGTTGAGADKGLRFTAPVGTGTVLLRLRNLSGASKMAAAIYDGTTLLPGSETADAALFTERTAGPVAVSANIPLTVQVDTADADSFGTFEVCVFQAGCGDGLVLAGEQCDDNNQTSGDGCSSSCTLESGKIVVNSCRSDNIPLFGSDCDDWTLPVALSESVYVELTNPFGGTLLGTASLRLGAATLASTGNVPVGQTASTAIVGVNPNSYTVRVCDVTGAGTGNYTVCVRRARRIELGTCFSSNVTDGDGNVIDLAGPISGGDEDVLFQPPATTTVRLTLSNESVGGLLASGIYDGQPGSLLPGSAVGASPSPIPVGQTGQSGPVAVNVGQLYRVYTDIASLGTAGTNYTICLAEVAGDSCLNPEDEEVRATFNLDAEAESAGLSCTGNATCISQTLQTDTGLSAACADCFGSVGGCAASNCALQCIGGSGSSGCRNCVASNCAQEFEVCSGWAYGQ